MEVWAEILRALLVAVLSGSLAGAWLTRRTAKEQIVAGTTTAELQEMTRRLMADLDVLKAGQATYQAYAEGVARLADARQADLTAAEGREVAALAREADCQTRLTRAETQIAVLFKDLRGLRERWEGSGGG